MTLYDDLLDAGDRLVAALHAGDLAAGARALDERARALDRIGASPPPRPPAHAVERFRRQDQELGQALQDQRLALSAAAAATGRVAAASQQYAARPPRPVLLDTVPR